MSFSGDRLITAGSSSRLQMFKVDFSEIGTRGKGLEHLFECKLNSGKLSDVNVAPPGTRVASVRVHDVDFMPCDSGSAPSKFLAVEGRRLYLWDIDMQRVTASEMVSYDQVISASWSPHLPYGSLIAASGVDHHLSVIDARLMGSDSEKSVVWRVERAHGGHHHPAITSVKFNPFIPFWLASCGEDSIVRVWDLRYLKNPTAKIEGHYQGIQSMTWSNSHAEILVTGSSDCTFRAWCIDSSVITPMKSSRSIFVGSPATEWGDTRPSSPQNLNSGDSGLQETPFCIGGRMISDVSLFSAPVIAVDASWSHRDTFYALSAVGELTAVTLRPNLFKTTAPHRFNAQENPQEANIESSIYARDLAGAFEQVVELSRTSLAERRTFGKYERKMIELCTAKEPICPSSWAIANRGGVSLAGSLRKIIGPWKDEGKEGGKEMVERFRMDLETYSYFLPPRFGEFKRWYELIPAKTRLELEMIILRFNILVDVSKKNWENVLKAEESICKGIQSDPTFMEPDYLKLLIESIIPNDFSRGLSMGYKLINEVERSGILSGSPRFPKLAGLISLLLFPTVFESATWITDPSNLERKWVEGRGPKMRQIWVRGFLDDESKKVGEKVTAKASAQPKASKRRVGETVQEDEERKKSSAVEALLADSGTVLNMIMTEMKVLKALGKSTSNEDIAETLIQIITGEDEGNPKSDKVAADTIHESKATNLNMAGIKFAYRPTISSTTNRLYLDSLLLTKRFEEYFTLCNDFCVSYHSFEFPKSILRHAELTAIPKLKAHIDSLVEKSATFVSEATQMVEKTGSQPNSVVGQAMTGGIKPLREGLCIIVKIAVVLAQLVEMKDVLEKDGIELIARCVVPLTGMLSLLGGSTFKILEQMEKMFGKLGSAGAYASLQIGIRDAASITQEDIRQLCRGYSKPSEAKTRATATIISTATGANVRDSGSASALMEEVFAIIEKLGKVAKPQT
ncbi:hypothetical protein BDR26DRAFT_897094 [Obelidium mucronatum]|nr:hypothetical protein BDR26DRAFT_897094 [Obelidium mucronatum]